VQDRLDNITIALAGMLQAITLIRELTQTGKLQESAFKASLHSIFQTQPRDILSVYGGLPGIQLGLTNVIQFASKEAKDPLQNRYLLSLIHLQKKLAYSPKTLKILADRLKQVQKQVDYFSLTHPTVIANLADIYQTTMSAFRFRIIMLGNQRILNVRENMDKVRALLLAGIRSAVLWRQMGGSRLQLLFSRAKLKIAAEKILSQIETHYATQDLL